MAVGTGLNRQAKALADRMAADAAALGIAAAELPSGARLLDCGVKVPGGLEAGRRFAEVCLSGLGTVTLVPWADGDLLLPGVAVWTDRPAAACLGAQYAGWQVRHAGYVAMGSGPARLLGSREPMLEDLGLAPEDGTAVLALETRALPDDGVACYVADRCGVDPRNLTLLAAPTASLVGSVQVAARVVETALHKLLELGFDVRRIVSGFGTAPVPPVAGTDLEALGRTNDCLLYGGRVWLTLDGGDEELPELVGRIPSAASPDYGQPFLELFRAYGDFYKIDPLLFSPAAVWMTSMQTGRTFRSGSTAPALLERSLF